MQSIKSSKFIMYLFPIWLGISILMIFPKWTIDDAYITYRYAQNFADFGQLTFNIGLPPIEGYTGIFLPVVLAFFIKLGFSVTLVSKIIGFFSYLFCNFIIIRLLEKFNVTLNLRFVTLLLLNTASPIIVHALSGLETMLFTFFILVTFCILVEYFENTSLTKLALLNLAALFTALSRPEGILFGILVLASIFIHKYSKKIPFKQLISIILVLFVIPLSLYIVWKYKYYGYLLPNTFYAKSPSDGSFFNSTRDIVTFFALQFTAVPYGLYLLSNGKLRDLVNDFKKSHYSIYFAGIVFVLFACIVFIKYMFSNLLMNMAFRFFVPFLPVFLVVAIIFVNHAMRNLTLFNLGEKIQYIKKQFYVKIWLQLFLNIITIVIFANSAYNYKSVEQSITLPCAKYIKTLANSKPQTLLVWPDAGLVPYFTKLTTIDFGRLNDNFLSQKLHSKTEIIDYFFSSKPDIVFFSSISESEVKLPLDSSMPQPSMVIGDPRFSQYKLVKKFSSTFPAYNHFVYVRCD